MMDFLIRLDVWINVYIFKGNEGETMSSRMGRKMQRQDCKWCHFICRVLLKPLAKLLGQKAHCVESIQDEYRR